jgi:hypothetical protein
MYHIFPNEETSEKLDVLIRVCRYLVRNILDVNARFHDAPLYPSIQLGIWSQVKGQILYQPLEFVDLPAFAVPSHSSPSATFDWTIGRLFSRLSDWEHHYLENA